jgi:hypothetical protein
VVFPALHHLAAATIAAPDLTVILADGATTGRTPPPMPWAVVPNQAWTLQTGRFSALHLPLLDSVLWFDRTEQLALYWVPDAARCPLVERGSPLLLLWAWWLGDRDMQVTHGAAIGGARAAALLVGQSGSGKSTTALTSIGSGLRYLADDYCVVDVANDTLLSLYCSGKIFVDEAERFPGLRQYAAGHDDEKALYLFHPSETPVVVRELPLRAILVPTIKGGLDSRLISISAMAAVRAAAPSTVLQLRTVPHPADVLSRIIRAAARVPCYRFELGTEVGRITQVLSQLLN